jgi:hypothetical protein
MRESTAASLPPESVGPVELSSPQIALSLRSMILT